MGDIVLLKEPHLKAIQFPLGIVQKTHVNDLNEVTSAIVRKGKTRELVKRHAHSLIPYISLDNPVDQNDSHKTESAARGESRPRTKRKAALASEARSRAIVGDE